jgi:hypothetical protein
MQPRLIVAALIASLAQRSRAVLHNVTVYRMTPKNLPGIADRDTGNAAGDVFFTIYEAMLPAYCPVNPHDSICTNGVLSNVSRNVYRSSTIEFDTALIGVYSGCNPEVNGSFACEGEFIVYFIFMK